MKFTLKIANIYQIVIWLISAYYYIVGMVHSILPNKDSFSLFGNLAVLFMSVAIICSNIYLLVSKNNIRLIIKNLYFNKWLNLIQILNLSLLGVSFYMIIGVRIMAYYIYDNTQRFELNYGFFRFQAGISYAKSDIIFVGINILPIILFIIFNNSIKRLEVNSSNFLQ